VSVFLDERPRQVKSLSRFLVFALIAIIAVRVLTARLFYMQIVAAPPLARAGRSKPYGARADRRAAGRHLRLERPARSSRTCQPSSVKLRAGRPAARPAPVVVDRLAALLHMPAPDINSPRSMAIRGRRSISSGSRATSTSRRLG
jgi:hypothetical protein